MSEPLSNETKLDELKRLCQPMRGEPMRMVSRLELLALVECVDALNLCMAILKHEALDKIAVIRALDKGRDALANLEAL